MIKQYLKNQYEAALGMLKQCVEQYDKDVWTDTGTHSNPAWHIAYHAIFYANIYCAASDKEIVHWPGEAPEHHIMGETPWPPHEKFVPERSYSQKEILAFLDHVSKHIPAYLEALETDKDCWPSWYNIKQLEFHINNLRHIQHHTGQLLERQCNVRRISVNWSCFK